MANTKITCKELNFKIGDEITEVTVHFESDEPCHPVWGSGVKTKRFPPSMSVVYIIDKEIATLEYLNW